jgi:hypothetical protein
MIESLVVGSEVPMPVLAAEILPNSRRLSLSSSGHRGEVVIPRSLYDCDATVSQSLRAASGPFALACRFKVAKKTP